MHEWRYFVVEVVQLASNIFLSSFSLKCAHSTHTQHVQSKCSNGFDNFQHFFLLLGTSLNNQIFFIIHFIAHFETMK